MAINAIFGSDGLITRAQQAKELTEMSSIKDRMELAKAEAYLDENGKITADHYFDILEEEGIIVDKETDVVDNGDGTYEVTTEPGYVFEVEITEDGDMEIDYVGKGENIGPRIREIKITGTTTNSVTIEVDARNAEDADYTYSYKKVGEEEWKEVETSKSNTCTIENLEAQASYTIKVKVETKNGVAEKEISTTIGELPEGTITFGEVEWAGDGTASVAINTSEEGYQLQYQKNGIDGQWTTIGSGEKITGLVHNDTIYGRLFDGVNGTKDDASVSIKDEVDPVVTVTPGGTTTNSITVSVAAVDNESGMADSLTYTYYIKKSTEPDSSYVAKANNIAQNSYTFSGLTQETSYDVKVEVTGDKAGRKGTGTLANQVTTKVGGATGDLTSGNIVASTPTWSNGTASITLTTTTGMQIQYQVNGITEGSWTTVSTGATVSGLHHNDTVYARLYDGTNTGDYGSVSIQDGIDPVVTVSPGTKTTNSIQVSVVAVDNESGMADSLTYTYYIKKSTEADTSYVAKANNIAQNSYTFTGLTQETSYDVKVEVVGDKAGRKGTGTLLNQTTTKVGGATGDLTTGNIVASTPTWSGGTASITLTTTTGMQIQYQVNGIDEENWTTINTGGKVTGLHHNDTVYARLYDGTNTGDYGSVSIQDGIDPVVTVSPGTKTTNSITVSVVAVDNESGMADSLTYTYYIKKSTEADTSYVAKANNIAQNSYTFTGLTQETSYDVKVEVTGDKAGRKGTGVLANQTTGKVGGADGGLVTGNIVASSPTWSSNLASITLTTNTGMQIQYQVNGIAEGSWTTISTGGQVTGLHHNDTVYARLFDGTNVGDYGSVSIQDGIDPVVTVSPGTINTNSITVSVSAEDNESGMADSVTYTYYIKKTSEPETSYVAKANNIAQNSYTFSGLTQETSYDVKVEVTGDKAGRKGTGTLLNQTTTKVGGATGDLTTGNIVASTPTWSGGTASITLTTTTGMQIQYQVNAIAEGSWTTINTGEQVTGLHHNDTVYARLFDGINTGDYGSVSIIDNIAPTVSNITVETITETSIQVTVTASDGQSGLAENETYKYYANEELKGTSTNNSYTITGLADGTQYTIKVEVYDKAGLKGENSTNATTIAQSEIKKAKESGERFGSTVSKKDDEGNSIWIPGGFNVAEDSATKEDEGIVIEDSKGNQFVWVPVKDYTTMYTEGTKTLLGVTTQTTVYSKLRVRSGDSYTITTPGNNPSGIREPDVLSQYDTSSSYYSILGASSTKDMADKMVEEYKATYESIKKYKGFYIGRYELTGSITSPTVQKNKTVVTDQNWYNLKKACTDIVKTSYAQSTMIYGNQWDEVMSWLKTTEFGSDSSKVDSDSSSWGNYSTSTGAAATGSGTKRTSGYNEAWQANNIYDLAGNYTEWTQGANGIRVRVHRGGRCYDDGSSYPASDRNNHVPNYSGGGYSSRPALYIK